MEVIQFFIDLLRDPRGFIAQWIIELGPVWVYTPLFLIIFVETGLVVTPFLPGDSLLFCAGIFAADGGVQRAAQDARRAARACRLRAVHDRSA